MKKRISKINTKTNHSIDELTIGKMIWVTNGNVKKKARIISTEFIDEQQVLSIELSIPDQDGTTFMFFP